MPEIPDITVYIEALNDRIVSRSLDDIAIRSPFVLRSVDPPIEAVVGRVVSRIDRLGKRIAIGFDGGLFIVIHLMIAGRLHWKPIEEKPAGRIELARLSFQNGALTLTEAGTKRRASILLVGNEEALAALDPGGIDVFASDPDAFHRALTRENHTLKRALTDPRILSGIGNAYSDEILHRARLSPVRLTKRLTEAESEFLLESVRAVLSEWTDKLRNEAAGGFPEKVTAFRPEMAVHGRFGKPCPVCGSSVQRIAFAENETNYCPRCQTGGRILADRALSRLLRGDWPKTIEGLEERLPGRAGAPGDSRARVRRQ